MKKDRTKLLNASTSYNEFFVKPYGFCCDIKNYDPKLSASRKRSVPLFPSNGLSSGGPDIKIRIQEHDDILNFNQRSTQRNVRERVSLRGKYLRGVDRQLGNKRLRRGNLELQSLADLITSRRLRGPLQWYLEEEIAAAREIMMTKKQEMYNAEMKKNIKIAKQKEKRRRRRKKKISSKKKDKEDINEDETKNTV